MDLPTPQPGDRVVILDAGANTLALFSRHCSRLAPPAFGFRVISASSASVVCIKQKENEADLLKFWK
jgi:diaminopimelate decarboxylase